MTGLVDGTGAGEDVKKRCFAALCCETLWCQIEGANACAPTKKTFAGRETGSEGLFRQQLSRPGGALADDEYLKRLVALNR